MSTPESTTDSVERAEHTPEEFRKSVRNRTFGPFFFVFASFVMFVFLTWSGFDLFSALGADLLVGSKYDPTYTIVRLTVNAIIAFVLVGFLFSIYLLNNPAPSNKTPQEPAKAQKPITGIADNVPDLRERPTKSPYQSEEDTPVERVIRNLNYRLRQLLRQSSIIYWTMIISLIAGVVLIIFAGYLSSLDTTLATVTARLAADRDQTYRTQFLKGDPEGSAALASAANERVKQIDTLYAHAIDASIKRASESPENKADWNWPSTILRIGVIGMLVFLTQILISLYRYNSRLISFYGSRRDALLLAGGDSTDKIRELTDVLFPSKLDFGREPRHPLQEMIGFLRRGPHADGAHNEEDTTIGRSQRGCRRRSRKSPAVSQPQKTGEEAKPRTADVVVDQQR